MIRTQLYLPEQLHSKLIHLAQSLDKSLAEVVREFLEVSIKRVERVDYSGKSAIRNLIQIEAVGGPADLSTNIDHYLYGAPRKTS